MLTMKGSPKKGTPAELAYQYLVTMKYHANMAKPKLEQWQQGLPSLESQLDDFAKRIKLTEDKNLERDHRLTEKSIQKTLKEMESLQKTLQRFELDFQQKVLESPPEPDNTTASDQITQTQALLIDQKKQLGNLADIYQSCAERLLLIKQQLDKQSLPSDLGDTHKRCEQLNQRLEKLAQQTATLHFDDASTEESVSASFLPLKASHQKNAQWIASIEEHIETARSTFHAKPL